jgi:hypothetical protein
MKFEPYMSKVLSFNCAFGWLTRGMMIMNSEITADELESIAKRIFPGYQSQDAINHLIADFIDCALHELSLEHNLKNISLPVERLNSINYINLVADKDTFTHQVEALTQEIIQLRKHATYETVLYPCLVSELRGSPEVKIEASRVSRMNDYIRDPLGNIVYPFDFWEDCIEVCMRKRFRNHSNGKIAQRYSFKSSNCRSDRARLQLIADMLYETDRIISAVKDNQFPPLTLSTGKQPTMIF